LARRVLFLEGRLRKDFLLLLPRPHPKPPPALVRAYQEPRSPLTLNLPYYAARKGEGFALIPWDKYMEEAEGLL
jgi:hypothetical protein